MKMHRFYNIILISICLSFTFCQNVPKKVVKSRHYKGNINVEIYLDNVLNAKVGNVVVYDQYLFENVRTIHFPINPVVNKESKNTNEKNVEQYITIDGFVLTNMETDTCFMFSADSIHPVVKSKLPVSLKKTGLILKDNLDDLKPYIDGVTCMKDTVIDGDKFKLLVSDQKNNPKSIKKIIFYLNTNMIDFPFHPMSKTLDEKFGGVILKFSYISTSGKVQDMVYNYTEGLSKPDTKKVQRFVKAIIGH